MGYYCQDFALLVGLMLSQRFPSNNCQDRLRLSRSTEVRCALMDKIDETDKPVVGWMTSDLIGPLESNEQQRLGDY